VPPVELTRPPVVSDEDDFEEAAPGAVASGEGAESAEAGEARRRRRRGRRGGRGRRRGGPDGALREDGVEGNEGDDAVVATPAPPVAAAPESDPVRERETYREPVREVAREEEPVRGIEPQRAAEPVRAPERARAAVPDHQESDMPANELSELSKKVTLELLSAMGFEATVTVVADGNRADVTVEVDDDDELLTGQKGETRQALQHLLNRFINRGEGSRYHLQLEINDFWKRREVELEALARSLADEAISTNAEVRTGYLSSQERRIVHVTLKEDPRVKTDSVGEDVKRFVVIMPVGSAAKTEEHAG
jgi:spoIIIJ-associated protein